MHSINPQNPINANKILNLKKKKNFEIVVKNFFLRESNILIINC